MGLFLHICHKTVGALGLLGVPVPGWSLVAKSRPHLSWFLDSHSFHHCSNMKEITLVVQSPLLLSALPGCVLALQFHAQPNWPCINWSHPISSCWIPISSRDGLWSLVFHLGQLVIFPPVTYRPMALFSVQSIAELGLSENASSIWFLLRLVSASKTGN